MDKETRLDLAERFFTAGSMILSSTDYELEANNAFHNMPEIIAKANEAVQHLIEELE